MKLLLAKGADVNAKSEHGPTAGCMLRLKKVTTQVAETTHRHWCGS